ncbi:MAG: hypothetical protein NZ889_02405 [Candidatus Pacearchaeota archaeon]|nr:hypothetical protein [Candidatus Pacearchaeota archaeon]
MEKNRKGVHHVEYVISVSIFFLALLFFLYFFSFYVERENLPIEELEKIFLEETQVSVSVVLLVTEQKSNCFRIKLNSNFFPEEKKILIKGINGEKVTFNLSGDEILMNSQNDLNYFFVYFSNDYEFESERAQQNCQFFNTYNYSLPYEEKFISKEKILGFAYNKAKQKLGRDFFINVTILNDGSMDIGKIPPKVASVETKELKLKIINSTANIMLAKIILQVW